MEERERSWKERKYGKIKGRKMTKEKYEDMKRGIRKEKL